MNKTEVMLVGTIHGLHLNNSYYSFEGVFQIVKNFHPDILGVEIRPEDFNQERDYLKLYYPYEMIESKFRFQDDCEVFGFDYYEQSVEGKLIPENYFPNLEYNKLNHAFESDEQFERERDMLEVLDDLRFELIRNRTGAEINDGKYQVASKAYYRQLEVLLKDTPYQGIADYNRTRDEQIARRIIESIKNNPGKKLLFLMGIDHKAFSMDTIMNELKDEIKLVELID